ncbi:MAG: hypothetical protein HMLKMBBP_00066 [Planctomycetes bacterium]|nr:hypothetical protein [Planctomycetota bacterium]
MAAETGGGTSCESASSATVPSSGRRRGFRIAAAALPLAGVALLELGLRAAGWTRPVDPPLYRFSGPVGGEWLDGEASPMRRDPHLFWRLKPGWTDGGAPVNARGYRTPEVAIPKPAGVRRVACIGDSVTFGLPLEMHEAWPARLERLMRGRGEARAECVNFGVPGYASLQGLRVAEIDAPAYAPDVVVAAFGHFNDFVPAVGRTDAEQRPPAFWRTLRIVELAATVAGRTDARAAPDERRILRELDTRDFTGKRRTPPADFESNLRAIVAAARAAGAAPVLLACPLPAETVRRNPAALEYADITRRVASELGVPLADGWRAFAASARSDDALFRDFCHPSPFGQDLLAAAVLEAIPR